MLGKCSTRQHCAKCCLLSVSPWPPTGGRKLSCVPGTQGLAWQWLSQTSGVFSSLSVNGILSTKERQGSVLRRGDCAELYKRQVLGVRDHGI